MYASAIAVDLLCSTSSCPSMDDWGSASSTSAAVSAGILVHNVLPKAFRLAMPNWTAMRPDNDREDNEGANELRARVQRKTWRTMKTFDEYPRWSKIVLLCFCSTPLERLMSELQRVDELHNGLLDTVFADDLNPFSVCSRACASMAHAGSSGPIGYLMAVLPEHRRDEILQEASKLLLGIGSQVKWRFAEYDEFPFRWAWILHPRVSASDKESVYDDFFDDLYDCCRGDAFDKKVYRLFGNKEAMKAAVPWWNGWRAFCHAFRFCNMNMERLFACFRQWVRSDNAEVERMLSTGFLGQWLQEHLRKGFQHPAHVTRQDLLEAGVPIRAGQRQGRSRQAVENPRKQCGSFVKFMQIANKEWRNIKDSSTVSYKDWRKAKLKKWSEMQDHTKDIYVKEAELDFVQRGGDDEKGRDVAGESTLQRGDGASVETVIDFTGTKTTPYKVSMFKQTVRQC